MAENLIAIAVLRDFIQLLIWTGQLLDERPASAIIIAPPGSGKTSLLETLECDQATFVGDLTARPLSGLARSSDKLTHILLGDMLSIFGHKSSTVDLTMRLISQLTGEKLKQDPWSGAEIPPRMLGLITAIPPEDMKSRKIHKQVYGGGFATRFLIARYSYKQSTIEEIHQFIKDNGYASGNGLKPFFIAGPGKLVVTIPEKLAERIRAMSLLMKTDPLGFRAHRHIRALVKAAARREGKLTVEKRHLAIVQAYAEFFEKAGKEL